MLRIVNYARSTQETSISDIFKSILERVPGLRIEETQSETFADAIFRVGKMNIALEYRPNVLPGDVPRIVQQLRDRSNSFDGPAYAVIAADFLSPATMERIGKAGMGAFDRSGNCRITFGQVYIETHGKPNLHRVVRESRSLFAPKAQRLLRLLLSPPLRSWSGIELAQACDISPGWVTAVRKALFEHDLADGNRGSIRIRDPRELLRLWSASDRWRERTKVCEYSSILGIDEICQLLAKEYEGRNLAFTQWTAANLRRPLTVSDIVTAYVGEHPTADFAEKRLLARPVERNGNIRLVVPKDPGVFLARQDVQGLPLVCDAQIWLDLQGAGQRADEQARALWEWELFGGWDR